MPLKQLKVHYREHTQKRQIEMKKTLIPYYVIPLLLALFSMEAFAQNQTQVVRGRVLDQDSRTPLAGVTVLVTSLQPQMGSVTNENGEFRFDHIPVGRVDLIFTFVGYEDRPMTNVLVGSGQEVVLEVMLTESYERMEEAVVKATKRKDDVQNDLIVVSARTFSVEETKRYAGAIDDPARMVSAFAGVANDPSGDNNIVVRGNSPRGILWRLEGVEIPNPNHFAGEGSTGGPINAMNSNMLGNSDFLTGAFSPEYGNALSGVFDMKLRTGNNQKREYAFGMSILGTDVTMEGPFKKGYSGSYLANYRYSTLTILDQANVVDFGGVPSYQDASFNIKLPIGEKHVVSMFGLGGLSSIAQSGYSETDPDKLEFKAGFNAGLGVGGITYTFLINDRIYLRQQATISATKEGFDFSSVDNGEALRLMSKGDNRNTTFRGSSTLNFKVNNRNKIKAGIIWNHYDYNLYSGWVDREKDEFVKFLESNGSAQSLQSFVSWKKRFTRNLTMASGLHYIHFFLNGRKSLEPRAALEWKRNSKQTWSFGTGLHSRMETISTYMANILQPDGSLSKSNQNLGFTKALHFVGGVNQMINPNLRFKAEVYYQHLFNVPVSIDPSDPYSILNQSDWFPSQTLTNSGLGRNVGLELTLERFLHNGFYYLATVSLYSSEYQALTNEWRSTAFNGNYITNILGGKEFAVGNPAKGKTMFVNVKGSLLGGGRFTPVNLEESRKNGYAVYHNENPLSVKADDVFKMDLAFGIRRNYKKINTEWKFDIQNVTNNQAVVDQYYEQSTGKIIESYQLSILPVASYKIYF